MDPTKTVAILYLVGFVVLFLVCKPLLRLARRYWPVGGAQILSIPSSENLRQPACEHAMISGIIPACSVCKRIRDDDGKWYTWEEYLRRHGTEVSHGMCDECGEKLYPWFKTKKKAI